MAQNDIIISSDDESDSGRRKILSKPVTSSNKASKFPAKYNPGNEEITFEKNSSGTLHIETRKFKIIMRLHIKCGFLDTEQLWIFPKNWLEHL